MALFLKLVNNELIISVKARFVFWGTCSFKNSASFGVFPDSAKYGYFTLSGFFLIKSDQPFAPFETGMALS